MPVFGQEDPFVVTPGTHALLGIGGQPVGDDPCACDVLVAAAGERAGGVEESRPVDLGIGGGRAAHLPGRCPRRQVERVVDRRDHPLDVAAVAREQGAEPQPVLPQRVQAFGKRRLAEQHRETPKRGADVGAAARQTSACAARSRSAALRGSSTSKWGATPASSGKRLRSD